MARLLDVISKASVQTLLEGSRESLLAIEALNRPRIQEGTKAESGLYAVPLDDPDVSIPVLKYMHRVLWELGSVRTRLPFPYQRVSEGAYLTDIIRKLNDDGLVSWNHKHLHRLAGQALGILKTNKIVERMGGGTSHRYYVAPWPGDDNVRLTISRHSVLTKRDEATMQRRLQEEGHAPVKVTFDLQAIPLPAPNPDSVLKYVGQVVSAYNRLKVQYDKICDEMGEVVKEKSQLESAIKELKDADDWSLAVAQIQHMIQS